MNDSQQASPFWRFSLGFYAEPGMADAFLTLQEEAGADVNLLLFLFFLAGQKRGVTDEEIARLDGGISAWRREIVVPLRVVRRRLKSDAGAIEAPRALALRQSVKRLELEAEHLEQMALERMGAAVALRPFASETAALAASFGAYARVHGDLPEPALAVLRAGFAGRGA